jgi:hypothetical protein
VGEEGLLEQNVLKENKNVVSSKNAGKVVAENDKCYHCTIVQMENV